MKSVLLILCAMVQLTFAVDAHLMSVLQSSWQGEDIQMLRSLVASAERDGVAKGEVENKVWEGLAKRRSPDQILAAVAERVANVKELQSKGIPSQVAYARAKVSSPAEPSAPPVSPSPPPAPPRIPTRSPLANSAGRKSVPEPPPVFEQPQSIAMEEKPVETTYPGYHQDEAKLPERGRALDKKPKRDIGPKSLDDRATRRLEQQQRINEKRMEQMEKKANKKR